MPPAAASASHRVAVNTVTRFSALAVTMAVSFLLTPFLIRHIGKDAYGLQALSNQVLQFVALAAGAFGISYERFAARAYARDDIDAMNADVSVGLTLSAVAGLAVFVLCGLAAALAPVLFHIPPRLLGSARAVLVLMGLGAACHIVNRVYRTPIFIKQAFYIDALGSVLAVVPAALIVVVVFRLATPSIVFWVALGVVCRVGVEWGVVIPLSRRAVPELQPRLLRRIPRESLRRLATFSLLSLLGGVGAMLYYATDSILISSMPALGVERVTDYNVAQRWDPQIRLMVETFIGILIPLMTADAAAGNMDRLRRTVLRGTRYSMVIALFPCASLLALAHPFLRAWLGVAFAPVSVPILQVIMVGLVISIPATVGFQALFACGRLTAAVVATLIGGVLNIALSMVLVLVFRLDLMGIALGSVAALALLNLLVLPPLVKRHTGLPIMAQLCRGGCRAVAGAVPLFLWLRWLNAVWTPASLAGMLVLMATGAAVYLPAVWFVSLDAHDRAALRETAVNLRRAACALTGKT